MKRLLVLLVLIAIGVVGLGFYRGWFRVGSENADGKSNVTLSVDKEKFQEDRKEAVADVQGLGHQAKEKVAGPSEKSADGVVVSASSDKLTMTDKQGKELSYALAANVKITCDAKTCAATDLKPGMRIRVTIEKAEPHAVTRVEAIDSNGAFEKGS
jgi:hypothetical protein